MTTTVLKLAELGQFLKKISIRDIKDVRALDVDLLIVLANGDSIIISGGAMQALNAPETPLQFADGQLQMGRMFQQIDQINVSPEANLTISSKEITRYNQNTIKASKAKRTEDDSQKPVVAEQGEKAPEVADPNTGVPGNIAQPESSPVKTPDMQKQMADVEINSRSEKNWGVQWPIAAGVLALLAAAAGGGGGGGAGAAAAAASPADTPEKINAVISGAAMLGPLNNATATAYDSRGNAISDAVQVIDGHYSLTLKSPGYKGVLLVVIRDNTPGVPDNFGDEASLRMTDLGVIPLRALAVAGGVNQTVNVTALTELAAIKAGLAQGQVNPGAASLDVNAVNNANNAVGGLFKVDAIAGEVVPTSTVNVQGQVISNAAFTNAISNQAHNYGAALKAIANLVELDRNNYPTQADAIQKLADALQFVDGAGASLKWATNEKGQALPAANLMQSHLFSEPLQKIIYDPASSADAVESAQKLLASLQQLPDRTQVSDYLQLNHVAIANPIVYIKQAVVTNPDEWQLAPIDATLALDQGDFLEGGLEVKTPPFATVKVIINGRDVQGADLAVNLPQARADEIGRAILSADADTADLLSRMDPAQPVSAQVTVTDGFNNRTNYTVWKYNADVRVDLNTPPDMSNFAVSAPMLVTDSVYTGKGRDDPNAVPGKAGNSDKITNDGSVQVTLTKALANNERLQFSVATSTDAQGNPIFGGWKEAVKLTPGQVDAKGQVSYIASEVAQTNGSNWVKARVVLVGSQFTGGYGNANTVANALQFNMDSVAPPQLKLQISGGKDDGLSAVDGITRQKDVQLAIASAMESGAELHYRVLGGAGTDGRTVQLVSSDGATRSLTPDTWYVLKSGERLSLAGDTATGNGKAQLQLRLIDTAGNFSENIQTFVVDSTGLIEQTVLLANREKAVNEARAAVAEAQAAFDSADAGSRAAKQSVLASAQTALARAQAAEDAAVDAARALLVNADGSTMLDATLAAPVDKTYIPAIINAVAATADASKVNDAASLKALVRKAIDAADAAVFKASLYGDTPTSPAPTQADFKAMGVSGVNTPLQLALVNDALKALPQNQSNSITAIQTTVGAVAKLLTLADGKSGNTELASLPTAADYAALGVTPLLNGTGARILGGAIDGKQTSEVATVAQIKQLAQAAQRIAEQIALPAGQSLAAPLTPDDFNSLGVTGATVDNVAQIAASLSNVPQAVRDSLGITGAVSTLADVKAVVGVSIGSLQTILNYAQGLVPINPLKPSQSEPSVADYQHPLLSATAGAEVNAANVDTINNAVKAVGADGIGSWTLLASVVRSYNLVLAAADGVGGNAPLLPSLDDYARVGVHAIKKSFPNNAALQGNVAGLLNQAVDASPRGQIDTVAKLDTLAAIAAKVVALAAGKPVTLTLDEINQLHLNPPLTAAQLPAVLSGIAGSADDGSSVNTLARLSDVAARALAASEKIRAYAEDASRTAPTQQDYHDLGIKGAEDDLRVGAFNAALATASVDAKRVALPSQVQELADAYLRILGKAGDLAGARPDPLLKDYSAIGATAPRDENGKALVNSVLAGKQPQELANIATLNQLVAAANALENLAAGDASVLSGTSSAEIVADLKGKLALLGVNNLNDGESPSVINAIKASADDGSDINSQGKLQALIDSAARAQQKINAYADDATKPAPAVSDYVAIGVTGVKEATLDAINSALASTPVTSAQTSSPDLVQTIVNAYGVILAAADGRAGNAMRLPTVQDYQTIGMGPDLLAILQPAANGAASPVLGMLNTLVDAQPLSNVNTLVALARLADTAQDLIFQAKAGMGDALVTQAQLSAVGITGLDGRSFRSVLAAIAASPDDGSGIIGTLPAGGLKLQALADNARLAQAKIDAYADGIPSAAAPVAADYRSVGLDLGALFKNATADVAVKALNSVLQMPAVTAAQVNPPTKLAEIASAYDLVLAAADGKSGADGQPSAEALALTVEVLAKVGVTGLAADEPQTQALLVSNMQRVLDAMKPATAAIAANLQASADALVKISHLADGVADNGAAVDQFVNALASLQAAGATINDAAVAKAAANAIDAVDYASISTPEKLQALIDGYARILAEANEAEPAAGSPSPNQDRTPDATPGSDPLLIDFAAIGAQLNGLTVNPGNAADQAARLGLLDDSLKRKSRSQVDTVSEITRLGLAIDQIMQAAALPAGAPQPALTGEQRSQWEDTFRTLGINGVDTGADGNLELVLTRLSGIGVVNVDTVAEVQGVVDSVNQALLVIMNYATDSAKNPAPVLTDYLAVGVDKGPNAAAVSADNLGAINAAVARLTRQDVDARSKLKVIINAYNAILDAADGKDGDGSGAALTPDLYLSIGVALGAPQIGMGSVSQKAGGGKTILNPDADKLALFNSVVGAQGKEGVSSPDKLAALAATSADLIRLAKESKDDPVVGNISTTLGLKSLQALGLVALGNSAAQNAFLDAVRFKGNASDPVTGQPSSPDTAATHDVSGVRSFTQLNVIATSYAKVLAYVNGAGSPADAPTQADYQAIGVSLPQALPATAASALELLNSAVHAQASTASVDSVGELNRLAITVDKLMQVAAVAPLPDRYPVQYPPTSSTLKPADLSALGLRNMDGDTLAALLGKLQTTANDGSGAQSVASLQAMADAAIAAQRKIVQFAQDNGGAAPAVADFDALGLQLPADGSGSSAAYLGAINDALRSDSITGRQVQTPAQLQGLVIAAQHVVDAANGNPGDASPKPTADDFLALGLAKSKIDNAGATGVAMLADTVDASTLSALTTDENGKSIALPDKLAGLLNLIQSLMVTVAGGQANPPLDAVQLGKLGVKFVDLSRNADGSLQNWPAIFAAIAGSKKDGSEVNTLEKLQNLVNRADASQVKIRVYADDVVVDGDPTSTPTVEDYKNIGMVGQADAVGVRAPLVTADKLSAINAALRTPSINAAQADTPAHVREVVDAYLAILNAANGPLPDNAAALKSSFFKAIGVTIDGVTTNTGKPTDGAVQSLLFTVIGGKLPTEVNTPAKINALGMLVNKVISQAQASDDAARVSAAELAQLGVTTADGGVLTSEDPAAVAAALYAIRAGADSGDDVNTLARLQTVVATGLTAYHKILAYANMSSIPGGFPDDAGRPTGDDFKAMGLKVPASVLADKAVGASASLLTAVIGAAQIDTPAKLQAILDSWDQLFTLVNGRADTAALNDTTRANFGKLLGAVGVSVDAATKPGALDLLQTALDQQSDRSVMNTPAKLEGMLTTVQSMLNLAGAAQTFAADRLPPSLGAADLIALGILPPAANAGAAAATLSAMSAQTDVSKIDSLAEVQALAGLAMKAQVKISAYADDARKPAPTAVDYLAVGLVKPDGSVLVTGDKLVALNSTLASNTINSPQAGDPAKLKGIVESYTRILEGSATNGAAPGLDDYLKVGLPSVTAQNKDLLDGVIQKLGADRIKDQSVLQKAADGVARILALADGADNTAAAERPSADDFAALGLAMGNAATAKDADGSAAALLGSAIDRMPAASVATVGKLQALVDTVNKLMDNAAGVAGVAAPTVADLQLLGIDISARSVAQQGAILGAIGTSGADGAQINSVPALNALAERAVKALAKITAYAQDNTGASLGTPTADDYTAMGVAGVSAASVGAINAALATTVVDASRAGTQPQVQGIASAYLKVLAAADGQRAIPDPVGSANLPTAGELASLGVGVNAATDAHRVSLLTTALDALSADRVNTPAKIDLVNVSAGKMVAAAGNAGLAAALTLDDFTALGVQGLDEAFLTNVQALVAASEVGRIDSSTRLQALVDGLLKDLKIIRNYADGVANNDATLGPVGTVLTPTVNNYGRAGVVGVGADTLASINAAVKALGRSNLVDSKAKLQGVVDAYQHVFQAADGIAGNLPKPVTREELLRIGVPGAKLPDPVAGGLLPAESARASASLTLLVTALDAQASRNAVSTPDKIANLADLATQVANYVAGAPGATAPSGNDLGMLGVRNILGQTDGNTPSTMSLINGGLSTLGSDGLGKLTLGLVQTAATAAAKIRGLASAGSIISDANRPAADATNADGTPRAGAPLTFDEFRALGLAVDNAPANLKLLNEAFNARPNFASVSDPAKIAALNLVDIVNRVMRQADADLRPDQAPAGISLAEWTTLGLSNTGANPEVTAASISAFMAAIKARSPSEVDTLAELKAVALAARAAQIKISGYAERESSGNVAQAGADAVTPTAKDFADMGVRGLDKFGAATPGRADAMPEGLFTVLSTLASAPVNGARTATAELVQGIVDSANKVLALADGRANQSANVPGQEDYRLLGADLDGIGVARNKGNYLTLLNSVIDPLTADKADTPAEWLALATTAAKVLDAAGGGVVLPTRADLLQLGVSGFIEADLPAVQRKLQQVPADKLDSINTLAGLQALVDKAVAGQDKIRAYAGDSNNAAPTAQDYADMGVLLPTAPATVAAAILSAANKALASGPVGPDQAGSPDLVQAIVNSYAKVLALADGAVNAAPADLPTAQDYSNIGMDRAMLGKLGDPSRLLLLNQLVDGAPNAAAVDSPNSLNALAFIANKVQDIAAQQTGDTVAPENALSATDLATLGIKNLSAPETDAVVAALQSKNPVDVDTLVELQAMAVAARAAINKIIGYADRNAGDAPQVADYLAIGVHGVADVGAAANKEAINAALATGAVDGSDVSTVKAVQALVDSYNSLLRQADGMPSNTADDKLAGADDFANIGVDLGRFAGLDGGGAGATENAVKLLSSIVDSRAAADIDTPQKISAFAAMVVKIALTVQGDNSNPPTVADFAALKITGVNDGNLALVLAQLARQSDDGSNTNTWARLADAVFTVTNVPAINTIAGDDIINLAERNAGVTLTGTAGKDDTVTLFYPDGSVMKSGIVTRDSGTGTSVWNWSYTLSDADWKALGAEGANGIDKIIGIQSRNNVKGIDSIKVTHTVTLDTTIPVFGAPVRLELDSGQSASDGVTNNGKVLVNGVEVGANWSYRIDDGPYQPGGRGSFNVATDGAHTVKVRQTDKAGNDSVEQTLVFTVDMTAPAKLSAALVKDTGSSSTDRLTSDGSFSVNGIEAGASWQWSEDNGTSWIDGVGVGARVKGAADGTGFVDGVKNVVLRQVDVAGNVGPVSDVLSFTLDTTAPGTPAIALRRDTGISGSDRITNDGTVGIDRLEGTSSWQYSVDGGTTWIDGSAISVKFPGAADGADGSDGAKNVLMRQVDAAGNASAPTARYSFTLDTTAPVAPGLSLSNDTGPSKTDRVTNDSTLNVAGLEAGASWQYSTDNGTTWLAGSGSSVRLKGLPDGVTTVIVRQMDVAGNQGPASESFSFVQDATAPAKVSMVLARDTGASTSDRITNDGTINLTGLENGATWQYSLNNGGSWTAGSGTSVKIKGAVDGVGNFDGNKTIVVRQTDLAGNNSAFSDSLAITLDTLAPAKLSLALARDTGVINDKITSDGTVNVTGLEANASWQWSTDGGVNWSRGSGTSFLVSGDGPKAVMARQSDLAGNLGAVSDVLSFTLDGGLPNRPTLSLARDTGASATDLITSDGTINIGKLDPTGSWQYSLDGGANWLNGTGTSVRIKGASDGGGNTDGVKNVIVHQTSAAGLTSPDSDVLTFTLATGAPAKLDLSLRNDTGSSATDRLTNDGTVDISGLASGATWTYSTDNGLTWSAGSGTSVRLTGDGNKRIQVRQTDAAGNVGPISDSLGFTLDTRVPDPVTLQLRNDTGISSTDKITKDWDIIILGKLVNGTYEISLDKVNWYSPTGFAANEKANAEKGIVADPHKTVYVRQFDAAGNVSPISEPLDFIRDVVPPAKITASLMKDTGVSASDRITNDGTVGVSTMESGATLQYSLDGGVTWLNAVGNNFKVQGAADGGSNTDGPKSVLVRQVDVAGNEGQASAVLSFTLDTLPQGKLGLALANDTGTSSSDGVTSDGTLNISGLETGASWQYSLDDGSRWVNGSGASVKLSGDADKSVVVRAIDVAGNTGPKSDPLRMTLDTRADAPTVDMMSPAGKTSDGASVSTDGSFMLSGVAEKGAQVAVRRSDGQVMGSVQASTTNGSWTLEIKGNVQVSGLKRDDGSDSDANGMYRLLSASDLAVLQKSLVVEVFAGDGSRVDLSRPAYAKAIGAQSWYLFATVDGGYMIAQQGNAKEWYFQWNVGAPQIQQPEDVSSWGLATMSFSQIQIEAQQNGGQSSGQTLQPGATVINSNGTRTRTWTYWVEQTDLAGNLSPRATFNVLVETAAPPTLDLDAAVARTQTTALRQSSNSELRAGTAFLADVAAPLKNSTTTIKVVFGGPELRVADDRLLLDALVALDQNLAPVKGKTVGGVNDVSYVYTAATRTLSLTKTLGGTFTGQEVEAIVENIKLQNVAPTPGRRTIDISLVDAGKLASPVVQATLAISSDNLLIDLDPKTTGAQLAATQIVTDAAVLAAGVAFDANVGAPSATTARLLRVSLGGAGLNPKSDKLMLDTPLDLSASLATVSGRTVAGITGLSYTYDAASRTLDIAKTDGSTLSGSQVQSLVQSIKLGGAALGDGVRTASFALVSTTGETGGASTAALMVDTRAPLVDLDGALPGVQNSASKSISAARATAGESLFPQETVVQQANDIVSIKLAMSGAALDLARDKLVLDQPLDLNTSATTIGNRVVGGVAGLSYGYDDASRTLSISKTAGTAMTSDEVSSIVKAIQFKNAAPQAGDRLASLTLTDLAGNRSTASVKLSVDTTVPASLKATLAAGNQLSYKMLSVPDVLGPINKHTLSNGESVDLSSLMPGSGDAVSLLSSLKGIYGEWGGLAFSGNGNTTNPNDRSVIGFSSSPGFDHSFRLIHQNNRLVMGESYFFTAPDAKTLVLNAQAGFDDVNTDVFAFNPDGVPMDKGYDIGNLRLLFQAPTANVNTQPTIQVSFDGTRAAAGDVIRLMEGGQVLASRTLSDADLGSSNVTLSLTPASSLGAGQHTLSSKYIDVAGNTVTGNDIVFNVQGGATAPVLSNLKVSGDGQAAQAINDSTTRYAMVSAAAGDSTGSSGLQHQLSFTGTVGTAGSGHSYLVTVSMGGKLLAFNQFAAGDFKLEAPANVLAPGFYKDLSIVATDVTDGPSNGQSTAIGGQTLGWYWAPQSLTNLTAGAGDDMIPLGAAATANGIYNTEVQTGAGKDTLVVGASGATDSARLMARVSDFMVGMDKVSVAGQTVTAANLDRFVTASAAPANGTILSIDLDGPGPGSLTYTLLLVNVQYAQSNTHTIFGV
ncbi:cell wall anchor protein [Herbaspirillum seropedicae]|nr:Ig-like domain-containing protein [Herbaspirillum seropedicae]UMU22445.1 cell wall anchor protein [Herbaspirillum seropedicae]